MKVFIYIGLVLVSTFISIVANNCNILWLFKVSTSLCILTLILATIYTFKGLE